MTILLVMNRNFSSSLRVIVMDRKKHHSTDRSYKFIYKVLGIKFHRYLYDEGDEIEFLDTEIPDTGQRRDITTKVDGKFIRITELLSKPRYDDKLHSMYDYHQDISYDPHHEGLEVKSNVVGIYNPNWGKTNVDIDSNINFHVKTIQIQEMDGWKILSSIIHKTVTQEELSDNEAIDLLLLPDMETEMRIKAFMELICFLICNSNIPDPEFKEKLLLCEIKVLERFFTGDELKEMIDMLKCETEIPEIAKVIEKYRVGFDVIYFDGKADGKAAAKLETAENFLKAGVDIEIISQCTGFTVDQLKEIKRKL